MGPSRGYGTYNETKRRKEKTDDVADEYFVKCLLSFLPNALRFCPNVGDRSTFKDAVRCFRHEKNHDDNEKLRRKRGNRFNEQTTLS